MPARCFWEYTPGPGRCAVLGCAKEAHLFCNEHPDEGYFCGRHRSQHTQSVSKRNAERDSRPRELALALLVEELGLRGTRSEEPIRELSQNV